MSAKQSEVETVVMVSGSPSVEFYLLSKSQLAAEFPISGRKETLVVEIILSAREAPQLERTKALRSFFSGLKSVELPIMKSFHCLLSAHLPTSL
jgi:hypothetical protein